jgi:hypothetical protein
LDRGEVEQALEILRDEEALAVEDEEATLLYLRVLEARPAEALSLGFFERALTTHPTSARVRVAVCAGYNAVAELRPGDEIAPQGSAARRAADIARESLQNVELDAESEGYLWICLANALRRCGPDSDEEALDAYRKALAIDPSNAWWWFDIGVCHKWRGRWLEGLEAFERAASGLRQERGLNWNIAICATGAGQGARAVDAWKAIGFQAQETPQRGAPWVSGLPEVMVRLAGKGPGVGVEHQVPDRALGFELLSVTPLSPCHGVVQSASFRETPADYGDVVLWDGDPVTVRHGDEGEPIPVFPALGMISAGDERRLRFLAHEREPGAMEDLAAALPTGAHLQIHRERVEGMSPTASGPEPLIYGKLVATAECDLISVRAVIESRAAAATFLVPGLFEILGETKRAGQEHKAWGGLERRWSSE